MSTTGEDAIMSSDEQSTPSGEGSLLYSDEPDSLDERNRRKINDVDERLKRIEETYLKRIQQLEAEVEELRAGQEEMKDRTNLLKHVKDASQKPVDERAVIVLQRMHADAVNDPNGVAAYDYDRVDTLVGSGFSSRSPIYNTMKRAAELVDDEDLVEYDKKPRHADDDTKLRLDLKGGDLPREFRSESSATTENMGVSRDDDTDRNEQASNHGQNTTQSN